MPGYVNIGARVGAGTMVDTWATVGSLRAGRQGRAPLGRRGPRRRARAARGAAGHHRGRRLHRQPRRSSSRACWSRRRRCSAPNIVLTASTRIIDVTGPEPRECARAACRRAAWSSPGTRAEAVPGRHLRRPLRADHRPALREHRPEDLAQRGAARLRGAGVSADLLAEVGREPDAASLGRRALALCAIPSPIGHEESAGGRGQRAGRATSTTRARWCGSGTRSCSGAATTRVPSVALVGHLDTVPARPGRGGPASRGRAAPRPRQLGHEGRAWR